MSHPADPKPPKPPDPPLSDAGEGRDHPSKAGAITAAGWRFDPSYQRLPASLFSRVDPVPVARPRLLLLNRPLAAQLGLDADVLAGDEGTAVLAGNRLPEGVQAIAQAYAGHQFGHFTILGDGRALLLGEQLTPDGRRFDVQLKGSGRTPFSRGGDGRAALGPMLREYVISEAMHALGIATTRSLAVVASGEPVRRQTLLPGAVLTRVAASHIRIGTFEWAAAQRDRQALEALVRHTLNRHYPEADDDAEEAARPQALRLLELATARLATLVTRWQMAGFIHGVMNTDNIALSGETIDYGPCAFMDAHDPATVFSSIDHRGRYAYGNQPPIMQWNLARLAEALLPLVDPDETRAIELAKEVLAGFAGRYDSDWLDGMRAKLGLDDGGDGDRQDDRALIERWLELLTRSGADFTNSFRLLSEGGTPGALEDSAQRSRLFEAWPGTEDLAANDALPGWLGDWRKRLEAGGRPWPATAGAMRRANPAVIPRNHRVEQALAAAEQGDDMGPMERLLEVLADPWQAYPQHSAYRHPPTAGERVLETFCGT